MNNRLRSKSIGYFLLTIGMIIILGGISLIIFFIGYFQNVPSITFFGPVNDILTSLEAVLSAVLATTILVMQGKRWFWLNSIGTVLTWIGAFIVTLDSLMAGGIIPRHTAIMLRNDYGFPSMLTTNDLHFGFGLIGIWLMLLNFQAMRAKSWQELFIGLGFFTGVIMQAPLGFGILYPVWCIWLGRHLVRGTNQEDSN